LFSGLATWILKGRKTETFTRGRSFSGPCRADLPDQKSGAAEMKKHLLIAVAVVGLIGLATAEYAYAKG
jgi:hypothetical protein